GFPSSVGINKPINTFESGRPFAIECPLKGQPNPLVHWLKNGLPVDYSDSRIRSYQTLTSSSLKILSAVESDSGKYECYATNLHGTAFSSVFTIYIKERQTPPYFSFLSKNESVTEGSDLNLTCIVMGAPVPTVEWLDGEEQMQPERTNYGRAVLNLKDIRRSLDLTCRGQSKLGKVTSNVRVTVKHVLPPENFKVFARRVTSLTFSWSVSNDSNVISYVMNYNSKVVNASITVAKLNDAISEMNTTIFDLQPNTEYSFKLASHTKNGLSDFTDPVLVKTLQSVPSSAPVNIKYTPIDQTSIKITWSPLPPSLQNGQILGYHLHDTPISTKTGKPELGKRITLSPTETSYTLMNLVEWSKHQLKMNAFTVQGEGPWSDVVEIQTLEGIPGEPRKLKLSSSTSTSIRVNWKTPLENNCILRGYYIYYTEVDDNNDQYVGSHTFTVKDLKPATTYDFQISAFSEMANGTKTKPKRSRTLNVGQYNT
ncbi:hypothetical protein HELRODRAFT_82214, partial [Helobdella robusta]|uniref:Uncharacterized protein n=1 Tax=Helobdella robusta TaxID=6412 RepID=T1G4P3_HELRO